MLTISPSSAPWLESCLKRFDTLAVQRKYPGVKSQSRVLILASIVHECLARLYDPKTPGPLPHIENLDTILRLSFLRAPYADESDRTYDMERCRKLLRAYMDQADVGDADSTVAVERSATYPVKVQGEVLYTITARLDRVLRLPSGVMVGIDYKTGSKLPPTSGILINTAVLKAAYPGAPAYEFWIESLSDDGVERTVCKGEQLRGAIHTLTAQVQRYLRAEAYDAEPCEGCVWCPLRPTCQGAEQAVDAEDLDF